MQATKEGGSVCVAADVCKGNAPKIEPQADASGRLRGIYTTRITVGVMWHSTAWLLLNDHPDAAACSLRAHDPHRCVWRASATSCRC